MGHFPLFTKDLFYVLVSVKEYQLADASMGCQWRIGNCLERTDIIHGAGIAQSV
jgi:hypothetical protein